MIEAVVNDYLFIMGNSEAFLAFKEYMKVRRQGLYNDFGELKHDEQPLLERIISERPADLEDILVLQLTEQDFAWFRSKAGQRWFVKKYPVFAAANKN